MRHVTFFGTRSYTEGVIACSPGLQCEASYPGSRLVKKAPYPNGGIAAIGAFGGLRDASPNPSFVLEWGQLLGVGPT